MPIHEIPDAQPFTGGDASGSVRPHPLASDDNQQTTADIVKSLQRHNFVATSCFWASVSCFSTWSGYGAVGGVFFAGATLLFAAASSARADDLKDGARVVTRKVNQLLNDIRDLKMDIDHLVFQKRTLETVLAAGEADGDEWRGSPSASVHWFKPKGTVQ